MNKETQNTQRLLESAQKIIAEKGLDTLSIRSLAKEADVSVGYLYNYFKNKDALINALVHLYYDEYLHDDICRIKPNTSFIEYLESLFKILSTQTLDGLILQVIHTQYKDHFKEGLIQVIQQDLLVNKTILQEPQFDELMNFIVKHLLFEVSQAKPLFEPFATLISNTIYK